MATIPPNITKEHILLAINQIDLNGIPKTRESTKFNVELGGRRYPPKYLISLANRYANDNELDHSDFHGGDQANEFLSKFGFKITLKENVSIQFPYESHSWRILSPSVFIKKMDKSSFMYKGTGIPADIRAFFGIENMKSGNKIDISLVHQNLEYDAFFTIDKQPVPRTRLFWHSNFTKLLNKELPGWFKLFKENDLIEEPPLLRFQLLGPSRYKVEIINPRVVDLDIEADSDNQLVYEGAVKYHYSKVYERKSENRKRAIEIHGLQCAVCEFDFERHYGARGVGFIEIHHNKPLSSIGEEIVVNPETDLVPVCSNCHRMIHRSKEKVLRVEELRELYRDKR